MSLVFKKKVLKTSDKCYIMKIEEGGEFLIGGKIKQRRLELNLKQEDVAKAVGVSKNTISDYEVNKSSPNDKIIVKFMKVLKCDADYLFSEYFKSPKSAPLTPKQEEIIKMSEQLNEKGIDNLISYAKFLAQQDDTKKIYSSVQEA